jgi:hypothetical protein
VSDNWLKEFGFNPLRLPRRDLRPFDVLKKGHDGAFTSKVGTLDMLLSSAQPPPDAETDEPTGDIAKKRTRKLEGKLGLSVLNALFGGLVGAKLGANAELAKASQMEVTYEDVRLDSVPLLALQAWVEKAQITAPQSALVDLNDDKFAVVTAVLRSSRLSVSASRDGGTGVSAGVPEIAGVVSAEASIDTARTDGSSVTFDGTDPIAFGFQAYVLLFEGNLTLGLQEVRRAVPVGDDAYADDAWTAPGEVDAVKDEPLVT